MPYPTQSPVKIHKISLVSGANLDEQFVVKVPARPEERFEDGTLKMPAMPAVMVKQFEFASKRRPRAIRKARKMGRAAVMLFAMREDGTHFPISTRQKQQDDRPKVDRSASQHIIKQVIPGQPVEEQKKMMGSYRAQRFIENQAAV
jgi:hypothetical protein